MKLFKYTCGFDERYGAAEDAQDAYERRAEIDPTYDFVAVKIAEVEVPGYEITLTPVVDERPLEEAVEEQTGQNEELVQQEGDTVPPQEPQEPAGDQFEAMERTELVEWLKANEVQYVPQWGDTKLREAARAAVKEME
ncbi:hypothetical protein [Paenibacillus gorillae]|uniref:hypothetical protein n=1 Tax=Paenibacillus gorillae TaxID=1243662 RepID=UPI0004B69192|nr:hypothetical protein [Paenibacillus gorillae]